MQRWLIDWKMNKDGTAEKWLIDWKMNKDGTAEKWLIDWKMNKDGTAEKVKLRKELHIHDDEKVKLRKELHIHDDIAFSILSKLCIKSLKRFECVCKSWSLLFDNPDFMTMYRNFFLKKEHPYYDDTSFLLYGKLTRSEIFYLDESFELWSVSGDKFENRVKLLWPCTPSYDSLEYLYSGPDYDIIGSGSVNGIVCLWRVFALYCPMKIFVLWNPSTRKFKLVKCSRLCNISSVSYSAFGYDSGRNDYKVLCLREQVEGTYISNDYTWEIYSLRTDSWRIVDLPLHHISKNCCQQLNMDGLSHWMCESVTHNEIYILSFDWRNEVFITTQIDDNFDFQLLPTHLVLLNGSIALILNLPNTTTFHILVLGELTIKKSWTKMFIVQEPIPFHVNLIGAGKNGDMVFKKDDGGLISFNLTTQMIEELGITANGLCKIIIHRENLNYSVRMKKYSTKW
ncbi:F-box/kelch-repeat protein At3g06240-like [Vicia villosa]|uniref:F-box/kelch-repeat protein At3g06240-like n=1 Tax=Vicia villosa TaxID=3911 RepID=UPI00273CD2A7|nr:F-box/kelch-repeat protein At3g06240-like [Vicia villosa]XP_058772947.1 F-box/kelch-repeat protein At3g06240-like [Vicia villosa]